MFTLAQLAKHSFSFITSIIFKIQTVTVLSSTKAEFYAAVAATKLSNPFVPYLMIFQISLMVLHQYMKLTNFALQLSNAQLPTQCTQHVNTLYFQIQDWQRPRCHHHASHPRESSLLKHFLRTSPTSVT